MHSSPQLGSKVLLCALVIGASGCAASLRGPTQSMAGPAGRGVYSTFTPRDLVYERDGRAPLAYVRQRPDIDAYLKPGALAAKRTGSEGPAQSRPAATPARRAPVATPSAAHEAATTRAPSPVLAPPAPSDYRRYAARERSGSEQMQYRGGDVIVISVSTLLVILLVVIIVLLLT